MSCLTQWIHVVDGYCPQLFQVSNLSNVKSTSRTIPATGDPIRDKAINVTCKALADYLDTIVHQRTNDAQTTKLNRHLLLHGNLQNKAFFSQKNALSVMFVLDALVFIEMVKNKHFPQVFQEGPGEADRIKRRIRVCEHEMRSSLLDPNLLKISLMDKHV